MLCNEALVVNAQHTSSDVHAKLELEGASAALIAQDLFSGSLKTLLSKYWLPDPGLEEKRLISNQISNEMTFKWEFSIMASLPFFQFSLLDNVAM